MKITINKEKPAQRCEICHQTDKFDAQKQVCYRCNKLQQKQESNNQEISKTKLSIQKIFFVSLHIVLIVMLFIERRNFYIPPDERGIADFPSVGEMVFAVMFLFILLALTVCWIFYLVKLFIKYS